MDLKRKEATEVEERTITVPLWLGHVYLGMALWLTYTVLGFFCYLPLYLAVLALRPEITVTGPTPLLAFLAIQLAGLAVLPGLMFIVHRRRLGYLVAALLVPIAATVIAIGLVWTATLEDRAQIQNLSAHSLPRVWVGTLCAMAFAYDRLRFSTKQGVKRNDVSRHFACLPRRVGWRKISRHLRQLPGAVQTGFLSDYAFEGLLDFTFAGQEFTLNGKLGDYRLFVADPSCPPEVLQMVVDHFQKILGSN